MTRATDILTVKNLVTSFTGEQGKLTAVDGVSFAVKRGRTLGIVGESGCGKTVTSLAITRLLPKPSAHIDSGEIWFEGLNLAALPAAEMRQIRGRRIAMIFQEPMTALNPVHTIGKQISEVFWLHKPEMGASAIKDATVQILTRVGISDAEQRLDLFPYQLSGGMRQRVMIAMALACGPEILIADEPTTALDVTIQAQILDLMRSLQKELSMTIILISHDLGVIAEMCDDVLVMYGGQVVEQASVEKLFAEPQHPYTKGLLHSMPRLTSAPKSVLPTIEGIVPSLANMPRGCRFENRCPHAVDQCRETMPPIEQTASDHQVRCFRWRELSK